MKPTSSPAQHGPSLFRCLAAILAIAGATSPAQSSEPKPTKQAAKEAQATETEENYFCYDSNGNVVLLTPPDATVTARYSYDAFGKTTTATGKAAESNRYRFSTKPIEEGSGLSFYGFRYYSPELGRWMSRR